MTPMLSLAWLIVGVAAGAGYFASIWWSARQFADGRSISLTLAFALLRLLLLGGLLTLASLQGAGPLLATALGVVVARFGVMRRLRAVAP